MVTTLDTFHFEMSELNTSASLNTADSKRKRERDRKGERARDNSLAFWRKGNKKKWGKLFEEKVEK